MKKGYKLCPYCGNEIKEGAIKCQYCKEFLDVKKAEKVEVKEDKTVIKKSKKEKVESKKSDRQKKNIKINYSSIRGTIGNIFTDFGELLKVVFSIGQKRITVSKGFFIYILGICLIVGYMALIALIFGVNLFDGGSHDLFSTICAILVIGYLRFYLAPKRAQDHGRPGYYGLIPLVNAYYFLTSGDKTENIYGEKPSFWHDIRNWRYTKKNNNNLSKYLSILLFIIIALVSFIAVPHK